MKVYLTGFMGAGKTAVGERLGVRLGLPFVDLDAEIEQRAGASVSEIFEHSGEAGFRSLEQRTLAELAAASEGVIAVGGGTVTLEESAELMRSTGVTAWLNTPFATIVERIGALGKRDRPLFRDEVQAWELYRARLPAYRRCDLRVDVTPEESPEEIAARIALWVTGRR